MMMSTFEYTVYCKISTLQIIFMTCLEHPQFAALRISEGCLPELSKAMVHLFLYMSF